MRFKWWEVREKGGRVKLGGSGRKKSEIFRKKSKVEDVNRMCIFWTKTLECTRSVFFSLFDVCGNVQISSGEWVSRNLYIPPNVPSYLHLILRPPHYLSLPFFYCSSFIFFQCFFWCALEQRKI